MKLLRLYWFAIVATAAIWLATGWFAGFAACITVVILTLLEITFSADNAIVNSRVLGSLSARWQQAFMTIGIIFAVFVVRFLLPIMIVMLTAGLDFNQVLDLALNHPTAYADVLLRAEPFINAFGGSFLLLIALSYFIDYEKQTYWLGWLERRLGKLGQLDNVTTFIMLAASITLYISTPAEHSTAVLLAAIWAMLLYNGLRLMEAFLERRYRNKTTVRRGWAGLASFLYLLVIDTAFSLDGVVGAFAITNSVVLIMAGLGAGAVWVRAITGHVTKAKTLAKYVYLEHGAHWAIGFLGIIMLLKLYGISLPEWLVGSLGLIFISAALITSRRLTLGDAR